MQRGKYPRTAETLAKMSLAAKKLWADGKMKPYARTQEWRDKIRKTLTGRKRPPEVTEKIRQTVIRTGCRMGPKSPNWKGGITPANVQIRNSREYSSWRKDVFKRDGYRCVLCGIGNQKGLGKTVVLNADHIKPFALFPELRFDLNNGRTLCVPCHKKTGSWGRPRTANRSLPLELDVPSQGT